MNTYYAPEHEETVLQALMLDHRFAYVCIWAMSLYGKSVVSFKEYFSIHLQFLSYWSIISDSLWAVAGNSNL